MGSTIEKVINKANRLKELYGLAKVAKEAGKENSYRSLMVQANNLRSSLNCDVLKLKERAFGKILKISFIHEGYKKSDALLTNVTEDEIQWMLKAKYGNIKILEIEEIPTFL